MTTVRWELEHRSVFHYDVEVVESQNELRACPLHDVQQELLHHHAVVVPSARLLAYVDYWGTRVETFGVREPHDTLEVVATSSVLVHPRPAVPDEPVQLEALETPEIHDRHGEMVARTGLVTWGATLDEHAARVAGAHHDVWSLARALRDDVAARIAPVTRRTPIGTPVEEVLAANSGGSRDRAHLLAALCRSRGMPTRFVSGYLADDGGVGVAHAWVEVLVPGHGWHGLDPHEDREVGQRHVAVGRARDHGDVPPLRGAFVGGREHELDVEVRTRRAQELQQQQ